jgi:NitT/TauT family transport system substrate-binding protein
MPRIGLKQTMRVVFLGVFLWVGACTSGPEAPHQNIVFRLKWLFNISVIGDLFSLEQGYFAQKDLAVIIKEGGPERDAIKELELGHAQFGVASADQVIRAVSKGAPVVVLAQLFQTNPLQWIYRPDKLKLDSVEDLRGKTIGITYGGNDETIMRALLAKHGITQEEVQFYSVRYDYTPFYQGKVDLWPIYRNAEGVVIHAKLTSAGESAAFFNPGDFGVRFVANSVITTRQMVEAQPEVVEGFIGALLKGWEDALHSDLKAAALEILRRYDQDTSEELLSRQYPVTRELIKPTAQTAVGAIDLKAWRQTEAIMLGQHLIATPVRIENYIHPVLPLE